LQAVQVERFGVENLKVQEVADPVSGPGEVLIATEAATVNPADLAIVTGTAASRFPPEAVAPYIPGWDLVGQVVGCADDVDNTMKGSRVVGFTNWFTTGRGTQASVVALPATNVVIAPDGLPSTELTTVGVNGLTAWRGLSDLNLRTGDTLVITGAAGGVGGFATELAVVRGLTVIAAVREDARGAAHALGAHAVARVGDEELATLVRRIVPDGADALLDTASIGVEALGAVRDGGRYVTLTVPPPPERDITVTRSSVRMDTEGLTTLVAMASERRLHTPVAAEFDLHSARLAYEAFANRKGRGRIVLTCQNLIG
jgi:NADPH:quinone reductase-like Zn-dependent oxidoreductase